MHKELLRQRIKIGCQFIEQSLRLGNQHPVRKNKKQPPYNLMFDLQSFSLLCTAGKYLGDNECINIVHEKMNLDAYEFKYDTGSNVSSVIIFNGNSPTPCTAMAGVICLKLNEIKKAKSFLDSLLLCIKKDRITPSFALISDSSETTSERGLIGLALLYGFHVMNYIPYREAAKIIAQQIVSQPLSFNGYDAWFLKMVDYMSVAPDIKSDIRRKQIASQMSKFTISSMTSLFAAIAQQSSLACGHFNEDILKLQLDLQSNETDSLGLAPEFTGAFIQKRKSPDIRIDYTIHNLLSFLQYGQEYPTLEYMI